MQGTSRFAEDDAVTTPNGDDIVLKLINSRIRVEHESGTITWVERSSVHPRGTPNPSQLEPHTNKTEIEMKAASEAAKDVKAVEVKERASEPTASDETMWMLLRLGFTQAQFAEAKVASHGSSQAAVESLLNTLPDVDVAEERCQIDAVPAPDAQRETALGVAARHERDVMLEEREAAAVREAAKVAEMQAARVAEAASEEAALKAAAPVCERFRAAQQRRQAGGEALEGCMHEETIEDSQSRYLCDCDRGTLRHLRPPLKKGVLKHVGI